MTWVAVAIGGSALIGAGASYAGSKKQAKGAERAGEINLDMFNTLNRQQQPFIQSGYGAMGRLNTLLGLNPNPRARQPQMSPPMTAGPAYSPLPGGGVQPIMQVGGDRRMYAGGPGGDPYMGRNAGGNVRLNQLLMMRAMNGDRQAQAMLGRG